MVSAISTHGQVSGPAPVRSLLAQIKLGLEFPRDPLGILARWQAAYGDFYRLQIGEMQQFFIVHPDDIREVLVTQASKFIKDFQYRDPKAGIARYLGNGFAMMEARLLLATIASRYRLELAPGHVVKPAPLITLNPKNGMPMIVRSRSVA